MYDYLVIGAGLFGSVFAHEAKNAGKNVCVIDKRNHTGGNIYCENIHGINVHKYGMSSIFLLHFLEAQCVTERIKV